MAKTEYIDRRYVLFSIEDHKKVADNCTEMTKDISDIVHNQIAEIVKIIPTADVSPVVLCRDCIYAPIGNQDGADLEWPCDDFPERNPCPFKCEDRWYSRKPAPDFFCANGIKRSRNE